MKDNPSQTSIPACSPAVGRVLGEAVLVTAFGVAFAFVANQISPRGLLLARDYFPSGATHEVRPVAGGGLPHTTGTNSEPLSPVQLLAAQMKEKGLQLIDGRQALEYFHDPQFLQGAIIFVDARDKELYQAGHIPGAFEFDPYHPENYFASILPACQKAAQVMVYCNGGNCDDSESAALLLRDVGIQNQKIFVYAGGFTEWKNSSLPVETGARDSGILLNMNTPTNTGK